jgi:hypothetical protein
MFPHPVHPSATIKKVKIPRRADVKLDGLKAKDSTGHFRGEWIEFPKKGKKKAPHKGSTAHPDDRVILMAHGK